MVLLLGARWEEFEHLAPASLNHLKVCPSCEKSCDGKDYCLESISWPLKVDVEHRLQEVLHELQPLSRQLEHEELLQVRRAEATAEAGEDLRRMRECEQEAARLSRVVDESAWTTGSSVLVGVPKNWIGLSGSVNVEAQKLMSICRVRALAPTTDQASETPEMEEILPGEIVRRELPHWIPALRSEYESLVTEAEAVAPLSDEEFMRMSQDPSEKLELIPGKVVFTIKTFSGRSKARAVACGCFQNSQAGGKEHTFASGISAEATRLLLRKAGPSGYAVGSIDI